MNGSAKRSIQLCVGLLGLLTLAWALTGEAAKPASEGIPLPTDWSHSHLIFSRPRTAQQLAEVENDPRYRQQLHRRSLRLELPESVADSLDLRSATKTGRRIKRDWAEDMGSGATVGAANFPAKFSFSSTTANCGGATTPDYVVFSTGLNGTSSQANIVAYDNLYSGCPTGTVPSVYWAYNITDAHIGSGQILSSPVPSLDGSQIAFVQHTGTQQNGTASLILLKWAASPSDTVTSPETPASVNIASYAACSAPCFTAIDLRSGLNTTTDDTTSSVFYDYTRDVAWVGDSQGWLHQFTGIFNGLPAEVRTGGFPVQVPAAGIVPLSSPVYDRISKSVFVGDESGFLSRVDAITGTVTQSGQLDFAVLTGFVDSPVVDVINGLVYVFVSDDGSTACAGGADCAGVFQLSTNFPNGDTGTEAVVGVATFSGTPTPNPLFEGTFDETYISSTNATGNLYVCGNTGANPVLYLVPIQTGVSKRPSF